MPSWGDGSNSSDSILGDLTPMDYAPDTILVPSFIGIAVGCGTVCSVHKLEPRQCVAFDGADTGRRFLMCQVENQVENCGIHSWIDDEWCDTLKHCLLKLWGIYHSSNSNRIGEKLEHGKFIEELAAEKKKLEIKHAALLQDVKKFVDDTERKVVQENYQMIMSGDLDELEQLRKEVGELRLVQRTQADMLKANKLEWEEERQQLKEEKRKVEYAMYDLFKVNSENKEKVERIRLYAMSDPIMYCYVVID